MATRYKDRITILDDAEIEELYGRPRFTHDERIHYFAANCIIYYNACILSELLERAERRQDCQRADAIKRANPASWKHVNLYGPTASWIWAMGSTSRDWLIYWRQPAVGAPRCGTEVAIF